MPAHVHRLALKDIFRVTRMRGINERVLRAEKIVRIVALYRLVQKRQANQQDDRDNEYYCAAPF